MKKEMLKQLIKEEIRQVLNEKTAPTPTNQAFRKSSSSSSSDKVTSGNALGLRLKDTAMELLKGSQGISSAEATNINTIVKKLLKAAKDENISKMIFQRIEKILDQA
jgi:hypothetical protein